MSRKIIDDIKNLTLQKGIIEKEETKIPPQVETILILKFPPGPLKKFFIHVIFPKQEDFFVLQTQITVSPQHLPKLASASHESKWNFQKKLMEIALMINGSYRMHFAPPAPNSPPPHFGYSYEVQYNDYDPVKFMELYRKLGTGTDLVLMWFLELIVQDIKPKIGEEDNTNPLYS